MSHLARPRFSGPRADLVSERWARSVLSREIWKSLHRTTQMLARGQVHVPQAIALIQAETAEATRTHIQQRERERERKVRLLMEIDDIGKKSAESLIKEFGSLEAIAGATLEQLQAVDNIGEKRAQAITKGIRKLIH